MTMLSFDLSTILKGDLHYGRGYPVTIVWHIPVLYGCRACDGFTMHVVGVQPTGIGIKIPFVRKPLAMTGKTYYLICNACTNIAGELSKEAVAKLQKLVIPAEITDVLDFYWSQVFPDAPRPYTEGFPEFVRNTIFPPQSTGETPKDNDPSEVATKIAIELVATDYTREKAP
jgi:hypothetical protein